MIVRCHHELFEKFPTASIHGAVVDGASKVSKLTAFVLDRLNNEATIEL